MAEPGRAAPLDGGTDGRGEAGASTTRTAIVHRTDAVLVDRSETVVVQRTEPRRAAALPTAGAEAVPDADRLRVFLVDDSTLVRTGLAQTLRGHPDIELAGYASDDAGALDACLDPSMDALLVSSSCRSIDVPHLIQRVAHLHEHGATRLLLLANDIADSVCLIAEKLGVGGIVLSWETPGVLVAALRVVARGYGVSAPADRSPSGPRARLPHSRDPQRDTLDLLTPREHDVLKLMARGLKNAEIAGELVVSESTVKTHVQNLLIKLGLRNRASAVAVAYELGITRIGVTG